MNFCVFSFCLKNWIFFHTRDKEWDWGSVCPRHDKQGFDKSGYNMGTIQGHSGNHLECKVLKEKPIDFLLLIRCIWNVFLGLMISTLVDSHFVHRIIHFPTYRTWGWIWDMFVFYVVGQLLDMLAAVWTNPWAILIMSWKVKLNNFT